MFTKRKNENKQEAVDKAPQPSLKPSVEKIIKRVFVVDSDKHQWQPLFDEVNAMSDTIRYVCDQNEWSQISCVTAYSDSQQQVTLSLRPNKNPQQIEHKQARHFNPDILLVRKLVRGLKVKDDYSNHLLGFMQVNFPSVNNLQSIFLNLERPIVYGELLKLRNKHGDKFPLIDQYFYSEPMHMIFTQDPPFVLKIGTAEAGYGKIKIENDADKKDIAGAITRYDDFITSEKFIKDKDYDLRIQKIGSHIRAYKRLNSNWKGNVGSSVVQEIPVTDEFRFWAEVAGELFNGMDILTVDAVHTKDGKHYILEINDCASGLAAENEQEDMRHMRDLVIEKLQQLIGAKK